MAKYIEEYLLTPAKEELEELYKQQKEFLPDWKEAKWIEKIGTESQKRRFKGQMNERFDKMKMIEQRIKAVQNNIRGYEENIRRFKSRAKR